MHHLFRLSGQKASGRQAAWTLVCARAWPWGRGLQGAAEVTAGVLPHRLEWVQSQLTRGAAPVPLVPDRYFPVTVFVGPGVPVGRCSRLFCPQRSQGMFSPASLMQIGPGARCPFSSNWF